MKITILGAASFIGINLALALKADNELVLVDEKEEYFINHPLRKYENIEFCVLQFVQNQDWSSVIRTSDIVYYLISTNNPTTSNFDIKTEVVDNIALATNVLDACVKNAVGKFVFLSSGGTIYGNEVTCPISESAQTNPITTYGVQKLTIEKLIQLYSYLHKIDYRIIRLANPYGPYQRPNGKLGAVTTFVYKALKEEKISVYGNGSVIRDYIYIEDAISGILKIVKSQAQHKIYNLGSGKGTSVNEIIEMIEDVLGYSLNIEYLPARSVDVKVNYLNMQRFEDEFGSLGKVSLAVGIKKTADFLGRYIIETE